MSELFIELLSEEIPARMQKQAMENLNRLLNNALINLNPTDAKTFSTPRRIAVSMQIDATIPAQELEERGPRITAPEKALEGFLRKHAAQKNDLIEENGFWVLKKIKPEQSASQFIQEKIPQILWQFPWPKSQRWGNGSQFTWVRPLHRITCILDGEIVPFTLAKENDDAHGLSSDQITEGHRFLSPSPFTIHNTKQWQETLFSHYVIADSEQRRNKILADISKLAENNKLQLVSDEGLLNEVTGLVEWPVAYMGKIDSIFMDLPQEVMQVSMRVNQRYFALKNQDGSPAARFIFIANIIRPDDDGSLIIAGNERVLRARFADARYFWEQDRKTQLVSYNNSLNDVIFHARLGSQYERVQRIVKIAGFLANLLCADVIHAQRAALLCKADLATGMVGEFPELQGIMGGYYAQHDNENPAVALAIKEHYKPCGPNDQTPTEPCSVIVALADKIDLLTAFFAIGEKPKGSGDPFALRRAALGIIRIIRENNLSLDLEKVLEFSISTLPKDLQQASDLKLLANFMNERLIIQLRSEGLRHDIISAVSQKNHLTDISELLKKVNAINQILESSEGKDLLAAVKRASNILRIENKKDGPHQGEPDPSLFHTDEETNLYSHLKQATQIIESALDHKKFGFAMNTIASLRSELDIFFDKTIINDPNEIIRHNRLKLLNQIDNVANLIADFNQIEK